MATLSQTKSRAVARSVEAGCIADCAECTTQIRYSAKLKPRQVIANVYENDKWQRVEHYHEECYLLANSPYGNTV